LITRFEKALLAVAVLAAGVTGLALAWVKHFMTSHDPFSVVNHPWQPYLLSSHVLVVPVLLFAVGLITREHILGRYRDAKARRGRRSGIVLAWVLVPLVVSGYAIQVLTSRGARDSLGWLHLGVGIIFLAFYCFHALMAGGQRAREKDSRLPGRGVSRRRLKRPGVAL
jgi:hypothetical protein